MRTALMIVGVAAGLGYSLSSASAEPICEKAALVASQVTAVPLPVLRGILSVESGGKSWILNIDGADRSFSDPITAINAAANALKAGAKNVDVGCFQISTRHHSKAFRTLGEMMSPLRNAVYAGLFLQDLRSRFSGDWNKAIACYHSCEPTRGAAYLGKVVAALQPTRP